MAKSVEVTESFFIGVNEYKEGEIFSFSDELFLKYSSNLKETQEEVKEITSEKPKQQKNKE